MKKLKRYIIIIISYQNGNIFILDNVLLDLKYNIFYELTFNMISSDDAINSKEVVNKTCFSIDFEHSIYFSDFLVFYFILYFIHLLQGYVGSFI
jgi:hypothetical protein